MGQARGLLLLLLITRLKYEAAQNLCAQAYAMTSMASEVRDL